MLLLEGVDLDRSAHVALAEAGGACNRWAEGLKGMSVDEFQRCEHVMPMSSNSSEKRLAAMLQMPPTRLTFTAFILLHCLYVDGSSRQPATSGPPASGFSSTPHLVVNFRIWVRQPGAHDIVSTQHKLCSPLIRTQPFHHLRVLMEHPKCGQPGTVTLLEKTNVAVDDAQLHVADA